MNSTLEKIDTRSKVEKLLRDNLTPQEIAEQIGISASTVYYHKNNIEDVSEKQAKTKPMNPEGDSEKTKAYSERISELESDKLALSEELTIANEKSEGLRKAFDDLCSQIESARNRMPELELAIEKLESELSAEKYSHVETKNQLSSISEQLKEIQDQKENIERQHQVTLQRIKDRDEQIKALKHPGARTMQFLHSNALVNIVMILLTLGIAHGVTAPILIQNGIVDYVAQPLAICADLAAYILLSRGVRGGWFFAFLAGVQVLIVTGGLDWIDVLTIEQIAAAKGVTIELHYNVPLYVKSLALSAVVIGAIGKFGELIHESQKQTSK